MKRLSAFTIIAILTAMSFIDVVAQRRATPVNNAATRTQSSNDPTSDSIRAIERRRAVSIQATDENGNIVMVDTVTGTEWVDSTLLPKPPKMLYPKLYNLEIGVNIWDPIMRAFKQHYGGIDFSAALNLYNRYLPTIEAGMSAAKNTPADNNYTYHSPLSPYFKIGADYNFIYNSDSDYRFTVGLRYGFSTFKYSADNSTLDSGYWGENAVMNIPSTSATAGWFEIVLGLRVHIYGPISAGWAFRYHGILHQSHPAIGDPWEIPGYGTASSSLSGSFTISYTIPFADKPVLPDKSKKKKKKRDNN